MDITNSVAVVTGANRGLGRHFAAQLIERGAKVYAAARNPSAIDLPGAIPLQLDITDPASVERAAKAAADATFLVKNVLSVLSWLHPGALGAYTAAKAAEWAMTDAVRDQLGPRGIAVAALHVAYMDTDMAAGIPADQKTDPAIVAALALDAVAAGATEILADDVTRTVKAGLSG